MDVEMGYDERKKREYDEIMALTNPAEKHKLLQSWEEAYPEGWEEEFPMIEGGFLDRLRFRWDTDIEFRHKVTRTYITVVLGGYAAYKFATRPEKALYSYGRDHPVKIRATEKEIVRFNRALDGLYEAQQALKDAGTPWDGKSIIRVRLKKGDKKVFHAVGRRWKKSLKNLSETGETMAHFIDEMHLVKN